MAGGRFKGLAWGMLSGASFGLIPLFTLPLLGAGLTVDSILFYRFGLAALMLGVLQVSRGESFRITWRQLGALCVLAVFYMASALFLLWGYEYMAAGVATTIHFLYPVCVVLVMALFFGERISVVNVGAVLLAVVGVALLSSGESHGTTGALGVTGVVVIVISALAYALYIVGIKKFGLGGFSGFRLTFFVLTITSVLFFLKAVLFGKGIQPITTGVGWVNVLCLALVPTIVSNFSLVRSVQAIGSTTTSILGAFEPLTAVAVGVLVFDEPLTAMLAVGICLVVLAVVAIVTRR